MNLLSDPWIPVRAESDAADFRLLTYRELLSEPGTWQISLPRDDLELACVQLLVCMTQVMFLPEDDRTLRKRLAEPLSRKAFDAGIAPCREWFDLAPGIPGGSSVHQLFHRPIDIFEFS